VKTNTVAIRSLGGELSRLARRRKSKRIFTGCVILSVMTRGVREVSGVLLLLSSLATLCYAVLLLRTRDYLACMILVLTGLALLRAAVELLRPSIGE